MALKFDSPADTITNGTTNGDLTLSGNGTGVVVVGGGLEVANVIKLSGANATLRVQDNDDPDSYFSFEDQSMGGAVIRKVSDSGNSLLDIHVLPMDGTSTSSVRLFRNTNTTGSVTFSVLVGSGGTASNARLAGKNSDSFVSLFSGNFGIRSLAFGTSAVGVLSIGNGTPPTTSPANSVQLYAADVTASSELFVRDEAGNVTQLSPHAAASLEEAFPGTDDKSIPLPMVIHHRNEYLGREEWIHLSKLALAVEQLTGQQFIFHRPTEERDWNADQQTAHEVQQQKIIEWQAKKAEWEASHEEPYDDEAPQPYELANMPVWMQERITNS